MKSSSLPPGDDGLQALAGTGPESPGKHKLDRREQGASEDLGLQGIVESWTSASEVYVSGLRAR